jgi:hypothetical protein
MSRENPSTEENGIKMKNLFNFNLFSLLSRRQGEVEGDVLRDVVLHRS